MYRAAKVLRDTKYGGSLPWYIVAEDGSPLSGPPERREAPEYQRHGQPVPVVTGPGCIRWRTKREALTAQAAVIDRLDQEPAAPPRASQPFTPGAAP